MPTGKWENLLQLWKKYEVHAESNGVRQNNRDVSSIPGYVIKKNRIRGAKHRASLRQKMYYSAKQMLKKARQGKHGGHPTILSRWYGDEEYRKSLSAIGVERTPQHVVRQDRPGEAHLHRHKS